VVSADNLIGESVTSLRVQCTGRRPVHFFQKSAGVAMGLLLAAAPLVSSPAAAAPAVVAGMGVGDFYTARNGAPLWFSANSGNSAQALIELLKSSKIDGLDPQNYGVDTLEKAVAEASGGKRKAVGRADAMLSQAFAAYVSDLKQQPDLGIIYVDTQLKPPMPSARAILTQAAAAPSLDTYVRTLGWMNPVYYELRQALSTQHYASDHERELLELNLERARALPSSKARFVMVNAAEQRLYMWEDGKPIDSMVVVVGKPKNPTPLMAAYIRSASLNPYWFVPPDLATERIAPKVLKQGLKYLDELGYQVMSDWAPDAAIIDPKKIDWKGVADGKVEVLIRQQPGPHNSMGRIKFMFPNLQGVYLHDNPERELFTEASRLYSGGCVRLEDAWRLSRWLFGRELTWEGAGTEEPVPLVPPVPVYITYLTAMPTGDSIAFFDDVYGRDKARLADLQGDAGTVESASR
jgi:murein L,D-transpeptidase YcbB/YkuD